MSYFYFVSTAAHGPALWAAVELGCTRTRTHTHTHLNPNTHAQRDTHTHTHKPLTLVLYGLAEPYPRFSAHIS